MQIYVCKHGVDAGVVIEADYEHEAAMIRASRMHCQKCTDETLADLLAGAAAQDCRAEPR